MNGPEVALAAGMAGFGLCWAGGVACWVGSLVASRRLGRWMKANAPGKWEELHECGGIQMTGSNAPFGMETATPAMWKWMFRDEPGEPEELRALKAGTRRWIKRGLGFWIAGAVVLAGGGGVGWLLG